MLKKEAAAEKNERLLLRLDGLYEENYYTDVLKIPVDHIKGFQYYLIEDPDFVRALQAKNKTMTMFLVKRLAFNYNTFIKQDGNNYIWLMKKLFFGGIVLFALILTSFAAHKFYVAIYQINYAPEKKMLQITARIFADDMNSALLKKYNKKTNIGDKTEATTDVELMTSYILENFSIKVNGQSKKINFLSKECENNVIICYFNIKDATKIKTLEIQNSVLSDLFADQQNIIQINMFGEKQSLLLNGDTDKGVVQFK